MYDEVARGGARWPARWWRSLRRREAAPRWSTTPAHAAAAVQVLFLSDAPGRPVMDVILETDLHRAGCPTLAPGSPVALLLRDVDRRRAREAMNGVVSCCTATPDAGPDGAQQCADGSWDPNSETLCLRGQRFEASSC